MTPKDHASALMGLLESDFCQSGYDVRWLACRDQFIKAINETKEEDTEICKGVCEDSMHAEDAAVRILASKVK